MMDEVHNVFTDLGTESPYLFRGAPGSGPKHPWVSSLILSAGIWVIGGASLGIWGFSSSGHLVKAVLPPLIGILTVGIVTADHWWSRGAFLIGAPFLGLGLCLLAEFLIGGGGSINASRDWGLFLAAVGAILSITGMAAAALGVFVGRRLRRKV